MTRAEEDWGTVLVDLEALMEQMPRIECESKGHGVQPGYHDEEGAQFYARMLHECVHPKGHVYPVCRTFAQTIRDVENRWGSKLSASTLCLACDTLLPPGSGLVEILEPIGGAS
jgi:hypothetical protein